MYFLLQINLLSFLNLLSLTMKSSLQSFRFLKHKIRLDLPNLTLKFQFFIMSSFRVIPSKIILAIFLCSIITHTLENNNYFTGLQCPKYGVLKAKSTVKINSKDIPKTDSNCFKVIIKISKYYDLT